MDEDPLASLGKFARLAVDRAWSGHPTIEWDIRNVLARHSKVFRYVDYREQDGLMIFRVEWVGAGIGLCADFWRMWADCAEDSTFVATKVGKRAVVFDVVMGCTGRYVHGHRARVRVIGRRVERWIAARREWYRPTRRRIPGKTGRRFSAGHR